MAGSPPDNPRSGEGQDRPGSADMWVADGFQAPDLGASIDAPPAYGEHHDQLQLSQNDFEAGAAVTGDGRVDINISQKNSRLVELLAPTIRNQLASQAGPSSEPLPPPYIPPSLGGQPGQTPPPKLNVVIQIVGSRGDVQPFVALGKTLKETYGHRVRLATHSTFRAFVEENGLEFFSIGGDPAELMAFMVKNPGLMPGFDALKSGEVRKRRQGIEEILLGCWRSCIETGDGLGPAPRPHRLGAPLSEDHSYPNARGEKPFVADAIIANPPSFAHIHVAEKLGIPLHMMFTMPWTPTRAFPHPLANIQSTNTDVVMTNYISYALVELMTWQGLGDVINRFRAKVLDLEPLSLIWAPGLLTRLRVPTTYCWSPALISKPNDWMNEVSISGFFFLDLASSFTPDPDLAAFLDAGPPPVYIGFGSIVVENPNALTRMIFDAVSATGVRALVSKGWGGLGAESVGVPEGVFMLGNCPHDWLFQRVSAVVHHGGAGTSAAGIKLGKPTVVVPFFGDQPFWGAMIARAGAGPEPIPYTQLTAENLAAAIRETLQPATQARAQELGARIREEKGSDVGGKCFHQFLKLDNMRCSLAPSRVAVWRVRRTSVRLSSLAAAVLVKNQVIRYSDLKLNRPTEYVTEGQPWDPISAVTASMVGALGSIGMAVADFPREVFKGAGKVKKDRSSTASQPETASKESASTGDAASLATAAETASLSQPCSLKAEARSSTFDSSTTAISSDTMKSRARASTASLASGTQSTSQLSLGGTGSSSASAQGQPSAFLSPSSGQDDQPPQRTPSPVTLETAIGAGRGIGHIVGTGISSPLHACLGLARGFRNAPKLYNDDTVRPPQKVTDLASGLRVAGKEFGFGLYDGISGLVTQPIRGAGKEGGVGFLKGFGKGVGGLVLKPMAGAWSLPAYTMQGVHAEVRNRFSRSSHNYIIASRILEGDEQLQESTAEERADVLARWQVRRRELKGFYLLKQKEGGRPGSGGAGESDRGTGSASAFAPAPPSRTSWLQNQWDARKKWRQDPMAAATAAASSAAMTVVGGSSSSSTSRNTAPDIDQPTSSYSSSGALENEEFERAIVESVKQTSTGDKEEDERIERAIRASVKEMRKISEQSKMDRKDPAAVYDPSEPVPAVAVAATATTPPPAEESYLANITDEEYEQLIEQAVRQSLAQQAEESAYRNYTAQTVGGDDTSGNSNHDDDGDDDDDDEEVRRAIEESERVHREKVERDRTEEDIVLEYIKKQSLAEEQLRQQQSNSKGKGVGGQAGAEDDGDDDEDLRRALEESMKATSGSGGGPSSFSPRN